MKRKIFFEIGVDEAGRGPLAGPVAVGVVVVPVGFDWSLIPGVGDSKQISEKNRETIFGCAQALKKERKLDYAVSLVSASVIDRVGISEAVRRGIGRGLKRLKVHPRVATVKLDGLLKAPEEYLQQETIIKGDSKEKVIGLASILAKVTRDRHMVRVAKQYPAYGFDIHKGYGTKQHLAHIRAHGLTKQHRVYFCRGIQNKSV